MTRLTEEQMRNMRIEIPAGSVVPPRPNLWVSVLDRVVRILTLGKGRVVVPDCRAPIRWDGIIR